MRKKKYRFVLRGWEEETLDTLLDAELTTNPRRASLGGSKKLSVTDLNFDARGDGRDQQELFARLLELDQFLPGEGGRPFDEYLGLLGQMMSRVFVQGVMAGIQLGRRFPNTEFTIDFH